MSFNDNLFCLLRIAIGNSKGLTQRLSDDEWESLFAVCQQHDVLCLAFSCIQKLPEEQMPPYEVFTKWQKEALIENERREKVIGICKNVCETNEKNGFYSSVLMPYWEYSDSKDVDILCWSKEKKDEQRTIIEYVNFQYVASTHHIKPKVVRNSMDIESGNIPVEVHFKSEYFNCPWYNNRFEAWVREMIERPFTTSPSVEREGDCDSLLKIDLCKLPYEFYVVYQLLHLYRKLFCEGIRLGHLLEYYMVLRQFSCERSGTISEAKGERRDSVMYTIKRLGMKKFVGAVMYVLQTVFAMPDEYLICKPNPRNGSFVLNMTMMAGDYTRYIECTSMLKHLGRIGHHLYWLKRNRPFITQYPAEMFFDLYKRMKG